MLRVDDCLFFVNQDRWGFILTRLPARARRQMKPRNLKQRENSVSFFFMEHNEGNTICLLYCLYPSKNIFPNSPMKMQHAWYCKNEVIFDNHQNWILSKSKIVEQAWHNLRQLKVYCIDLINQEPSLEPAAFLSHITASCAVSASQLSDRPNPAPCAGWCFRMSARLFSFSIHSRESLPACQYLWKPPMVVSKVMNPLNGWNGLTLA